VQAVKLNIYGTLSLAPRKHDTAEGYWARAGLFYHK